MSTLYITDPATGKRLSIEANREGPDQYRIVAAEIAAALSERLAADPALAEPCESLPTALTSPVAAAPEPDAEPTPPGDCAADEDTEPERIILGPETVTSVSLEPVPVPRPAPVPRRAPKRPQPAAHTVPEPPPPAPAVASDPPEVAAARAPSLVQTFFAPAPHTSPQPHSRPLIVHQSAALVRIQTRAAKTHPR